MCIYQLKMMKKIAIFASGSGSNAENIAQYFAQNEFVDVRLIITNKADAYVLQRAEKLQIPSLLLTAKEMQDQKRVIACLKQHDIDFIVLAGYLLKIPAFLIERYPQAIINIHPALLPKFGGKGMYGAHVHEAVVAAHETQSGITIHYVNEHYDEGAIIFQATCPVLPTDNPVDVAEKVHTLEYTHFPRIIEETLR